MSSNPAAPLTFSFAGFSGLLLVPALMSQSAMDAVLMLDVAAGILAVEEVPC